MSRDRTLTATRIGLLFIASLVLCAGHAGTRELLETQPERVGLDPERLQRIDAYMNQAVADGVMVGGLGLIARHDRVAYESTWGLKDREAGSPMTEDTIFRIYSMSKPITGVALMMLYEEGKFFLNDPVARYIPELKNLVVARSTADGGTTGIVSDGTQTRTVGEGDDGLVGQTRRPTRQPTVRDLMTHTAGFTYGVFGDTEVDRLYRKAGLLFENDTLEDFVTRLGQIPLQYDPGTRWHYSVAVDVQGRLVEVLSGMRFGEFLETRLFGPLAMNDTGFVVPHNKLGSLDGVRILSPKTVELMTTNHLGDIPMGRPGTGFGLDFAVALDQGEIGEVGSPGEYNWGGAAGTRFWVDPEEELIGVFMVQSIPHRTRLAQEFKVLTYQAVVE
ncbi:MAG: serine hydrolase [Gammaproteobacteria bacterium]